MILNLRPPSQDKLPGPMDYSTVNFVKLSGRNGLDPSFMQALRETVQAKVWEVVQLNTPNQNNQLSPASPNPPPRIKLRTGIVGIERSIQEKQKATDDSIAVAFQDLRALMALAEDMVSISKVSKNFVLLHF